MRSIMRSGRLPAVLLMFVGMAIVVAPAAAMQFPVSGTVTVNEVPATLPAGGSFGDSTYDASSGILSAGRFTLPPGSVTFDSPLGPVVATYQLGQSNTSTGEVDADGIAVLTPVAMRLEIVSAFLGGIIPIDVGQCVFEPITLYLVGTGAASGLDVSDPAFTIPPVAASACAGYGEQINAAVAGSSNAMDLHLQGDFTPPPDEDPGLIFQNGFDS
ncbi:MAG: hypothetical protein J0H15_10250 [Xanthomonadales bacterium]|nr:hypothetical protein [Xanthomonadales bacterium]